MELRIVFSAKVPIIMIGRDWRQKHVGLNSKNHMNKKQAFTLIELVVVVATLALFAFMLLPALASSGTKSQKINCINNLKQVGIAFRIWEGNNNGKYPMAVSYTAGGASDYVNHGGFTPGLTADWAASPYAPGMVFMVMSNFLGTPKVLFCPADSIHTAGEGYATNFTYQDLLGIPTTPPRGVKPTAEGTASLTKISYFIGGDAVEADPQSIMAGDCNIGTASAGSPASIRFAYTTGVSDPGTASMGPAFTTVAATIFNGNWAWTANDLHQKAGNLLIADGSVQSTTLSTLHTYMMNATNTVQYPCWNFNP